MKNIYILLFFVWAFCLPFSAFAQCAAEEVLVDIVIVPDSWTATETSWKLVDNLSGATIDSSNAVSKTICVAQTACLSFFIYDQYGDGIANSGYCSVSYNGSEVYHISQTGFQNYTVLGQCPAGYSCQFAQAAELDSTYTAPAPNTWYVFTPDTTGIFGISTCGFNNPCATQIWAYNYCGNLLITNGAEGAWAFSTEGCDDYALLRTIFNKDETYYIRIGNQGSACASNTIHWRMNFEGPVTGCLDPTACNYNPAAMVNDPTSCLYEGDPNCPQGPDLVVLQNVIMSSLYLEQLNNNDACYVAEGCLNGYGQRNIIRFTTHIKNIGNQDYFIGQTPANPNVPQQQFEWDPCHNHWHYEGYAEYLLYDAQNNELPVGFKNGFCVMDLECSDGGNGQYGCGFMGISAHCGDIYDSGLECQWIDITNIPEGFYTLVVRVNWDKTPDAAGRLETNFLNNWAQVCLHIIRDDITNEPSFTVSNDCPPVVDCSGALYGNAQIDCNGVCGGTAKHGDLDNNGELNSNDALLYAQNILTGNDNISSCNDLNADGILDIGDISKLVSCILQNAGSHTHPGGGSAHDHCRFPDLIINNPNDTVDLSIGNIDVENKHFDVLIKNPSRKMLDYQLQIRGASLLGVQSVLPQSNYNCDILYNANGTILGITLSESSIERYETPTSFLRVYYDQITDSEVCLQAIKMLNENYEQVTANVTPNCFPSYLLTGTEQAMGGATQGYSAIVPNPFDQTATLLFANPNYETFDLHIIDLSGRIVWTQTGISGSSCVIERNLMSAGIYTYQLTAGKTLMTGKMVITQ